MIHVNGHKCGAPLLYHRLWDESSNLFTLACCKSWTWGCFWIQRKYINTPPRSDDKKDSIDVPLIVRTGCVSPSGCTPKPVAQARRLQKPAKNRAIVAYQAFLNGTSPSRATNLSSRDGNNTSCRCEHSLDLVATYKTIPSDHKGTGTGSMKNVFRILAAIYRTLAVVVDGSGRWTSIGSGGAMAWQLPKFPTQPVR